MIAEARRIGDQLAGREAVAEEDRLAAVPGMAEIPDLVAADHDRIIFARRLGLVQREALRQRQVGDGRDEPPGLRRILLELMARSSVRKRRLQRAVDLGAADAFAVMIEQLDLVTARAEPFGETVRLPVGAVVDAFVKGENTHLHSLGHAVQMAVGGGGSDC